MFKRFLIHIRPKNIPKESICFSTTFGLGGILTLLFIILSISGIILAFFYNPHPFFAYRDILIIKNIIPLGNLIRNIHRLSGDLMVVFGFLHMMRVLFSDAFNGKRESNWRIGVFLFVLIFPLNFTGYLLVWDTVSFWGATIVLNLLDSIPLIGQKLRILIAGSSNVTAITLLRFYIYHIIVLPLLMIFLLSVHFYEIRRCGGIFLKNKTNKEKVPASILFKKEIIVSLLVTIILVVICGFFYNAPLLEDANNGNIPNLLKAPWYFASIQFFLSYLPPIIAGILFPVFYILFLFFYPKLNFLSKRTKKIFYLTIHIVIIITIIAEIKTIF